MGKILYSPQTIQDNDWAYGWKGIGEASEFVLRLIENHGDNPIPQSNILQFLHFITNPLYLGTKFMFLPEDPTHFYPPPPGTLAASSTPC